MAPLPPWLNVQPTDFLRATEAGTQAGIAQAGQANQAAEASARLGMEAQIARMQADVRKAVLQQQAQRQQQQIDINRAYKEAEVGLAQDRLERAQALDQAKAAEQAKKFAAQQKFSQLLQSGMSPEKALFQVPELSTPSAVASIGRNAATREYGDITTKVLPGGATAVFRPGSPGLHVLPMKKSVDDRIFEIQMAEYAKKKTEAEASGDDEGAAALQKSMDKLRAQYQNRTSGTGTGTGGSKVERARQLHKEHPDWNKQTIIDAVNKEFGTAPQ